MVAVPETSDALGALWLNSCDFGVACFPVQSCGHDDESSESS